MRNQWIRAWIKPFLTLPDGESALDVESNIIKTKEKN